MSMLRMSVFCLIFSLPATAAVVSFEKYVRVDPKNKEQRIVYVIGDVHIATPFDDAQAKKIYDGIGALADSLFLKEESRLPNSDCGKKFRELIAKSSNVARLREEGQKQLAKQGNIVVTAKLACTPIDTVRCVDLICGWAMAPLIVESEAAAVKMARDGLTSFMNMNPGYLDAFVDFLKNDQAARELLFSSDMVNAVFEPYVQMINTVEPLLRSTGAKEWLARLKVWIMRFKNDVEELLAQCRNHERVTATILRSCFQSALHKIGFFWSSVELEAVAALFKQNAPGTSVVWCGASHARVLGELLDSEGFCRESIPGGVRTAAEAIEVGRKEGDIALAKQAIDPVLIQFSSNVAASNVAVSVS